MKKRKNIILSAITCFVSICLLMLGVYSASNPSVGINGQVSYTARDASVLVQGKTSNDGTEIAFSKSAPENKTALLALSKATDNINKAASGDTPAEYFDWTQGEQSGNSNIENEKLSAWNVGTVSFKESSTGIQSIKVKFLFTNYSNYPVTATLTFDKTLDEMTTANVTRTSDEQDKVIIKELGVAGSADSSATVEITYAVKDDSKGVDATGLLGMSISLEKSGPQTRSVTVAGFCAYNRKSYDIYYTIYCDTTDTEPIATGMCVTSSVGAAVNAEISKGKKVIINIYSTGFALDSNETSVSCNLNESEYTTNIVFGESSLTVTIYSLTKNVVVDCIFVATGIA